MVIVECQDDIEINLDKNDRDVVRISSSNIDVSDRATTNVGT